MTASPRLPGQFSRINHATVILMAFPYIYSVVAMWRLDRAGATLDRRAVDRDGTTACLYRVGVAIWQSHDPLLKG